MKNVDYVICTAEEKHAAEIVSLFKKNYKNGYFAGVFESEKELSELLASDVFKGLVAIMPNKKIIGFRGLYLQKADWAKDTTGILQVIAAEKEQGLIAKHSNGINQGYLGNFLVDTDYRGYGIGRKIEETHFDIYKNLPGKTVVYGLALEASPASIELKRQLGFDIWGTRSNILCSTGNGVRGHTVIVGCTFGYDDVLEIESVNKITDSIIKQSSSKIKRKTVCNNSYFRGKAEYHFEEETGRAFCNVKSDPNGEDILAIIQKIKSSNYPYRAIYLTAQDKGLNHADSALLSNGFFPMGFLPYLSEGRHDIIEYQYIDNKTLDLTSEYLLNKEMISDYINSIFKA